MKIEYTSIDRVSDSWNAVDLVAKERKYLLFTEAPEIESTRKYLEEITTKNWTQFFAIESDQLVGWCDIIPYSYKGCRHVAHMGLGVIPSHRRQGIGEKLLCTSIKDAFSKGIQRIEMDVFSSNLSAIALYQKLGFQIEGTKINARKLDGVTDNFIAMSLLKTNVDQGGVINSDSLRSST